MCLATGDEVETIVDDGIDRAAKALGTKGGRKRAEDTTSERLAEIAR
ncbi:hypothetical protein [Pelagibacterium luteolum]|nr:hypothetical protein [Pelagibacterium luteolum]